MYILDVAGHGIASALLSVSIMNVLRSRVLPDTDFRVPGQVLAVLNRMFLAEDYGKFYTIWYGVYRPSDRQLFWAAGGHPEALLFDPTVGPSAIKLDSEGPLMGVMDCDDFGNGQVTLSPGSKLYLYTDGAHEIHKVDGTEWQFSEFVEFMESLNSFASDDASLIDRLLFHVRGPTRLTHARRRFFSHRSLPSEM